MQEVPSDHYFPGVQIWIRNFVERLACTLDISKKSIQADQLGLAEEVLAEAIEDELGMDFLERRDAVAETQEIEAWV